MKNFYLILFFILIAGNIFIYQTIFAPRILEISLLLHIFTTEKLH